MTNIGDSHTRARYRSVYQTLPSAERNSPNRFDVSTHKKKETASTFKCCQLMIFPSSKTRLLAAHDTDFFRKLCPASSSPHLLDKFDRTYQRWLFLQPNKDVILLYRCVILSVSVPAYFSLSMRLAPSSTNIGCSEAFITYKASHTHSSCSIHGRYYAKLSGDKS